MAQHNTAKGLYRLMESRKVELKDISKATGIPKANISRLLNDKTSNPTLNTLIPLARYFDISVSDLIGDEVSSYSIDSKKLEQETIRHVKNAMQRHIDSFSAEFCS